MSDLHAGPLTTFSLWEYLDGCGRLLFARTARRPPPQRGEKVLGTRRNSLSQANGGLLPICRLPPTQAPETAPGQQPGNKASLLGAKGPFITLLVWRVESS